MENRRTVIDVRGLTLEKKQEIWRHFWNYKKTPDVRNLNLEQDNFLCVNHDGCGSPGDMTRTSCTMEELEIRSGDTLEVPVFESKPKFLGTLIHGDVIVVGGHKYKRM